jgi:hypothetical protein
MRRRNELWIGCILALLTLLACGGSDTIQEPQATTADGAEAVDTAPAAASGSEPSAELGSGEEDDAIDSEALSESGTIEIKQYSVAYIGSGTLGTGTLTYLGQEHPFQIGGLGVGGIGVSSIDAHGSVYNLPDLESFTGAYGNARLGYTAADKGKGKGRLWLKNPRRGHQALDHDEGPRPHRWRGRHRHHLGVGRAGSRWGGQGRNTGSVERYEGGDQEGLGVGQGHVPLIAESATIALRGAPPSLPPYFTNSGSPDRQVLSNQGSNGP